VAIQAAKPALSSTISRSHFVFDASHCDTRYTTFETVRDQLFGRKELTALISELETLLVMANKMLASRVC
jgi:hypothetical protein